MNENRKIKSGLLWFMFIILFLPLLEQETQFIKSGKLFGGYKLAEDTVFTTESWASGTYQRKKEQFLNDQLGFRPDLVRLTNQLDYSFFDICHAGWTVKGKDQYLFQFPYIMAYYGKDFIGYEIIRDQSFKLKAIQDTLAKMGKSLVLAYLPSKASSYPEYFPADRVAEQRITNVQAYKHVCDSIGINQVDLDTWFVAMKHTSKEPLFSKQGIHWTTYGAILGGDSLTRYMERLTNIKVQHPAWSQMEHTSKLRGGDDDVAQELNLIFPVATETLAYPIIQDVPDTGNKINAIYIGDSYAHKMIEFGIVYKMNRQCEFWSYLNDIHDINNHKFCFITQYDWAAAIGRADCIVLAYTAFNFTHLGNGFIDMAYKHYYPLRQHNAWDFH